jgi:hypothetical protein
MDIYKVKNARYINDLHIMGHADMRIISIGSGAFGLSIDIDKAEEVIEALKAAVDGIRAVDAIDPIAHEQVK